MGLNLGELYGTIGLDTGPLSAGFAKAKDMLGKWGESMKKKSEEDGKGSGSKWTKGWQAAALIGAASAGIAVASVVAGAIVRGMNLEPARDKIQAELGLSTEQAERVGRVAGKAYSNNFGESLEGMNAVVGVVLSSMDDMWDASDKSLQDVSEKLAAFSDIFEIDVTRAAQVAGQMVKSGFAKDSNEALDLLTRSLQNVPKAVREDIMDAVDEYGPFFNNIGLKGQEAMEILVEASQKGMYGIDKTGDAIKEFGIRATDMSASSKVAFDNLGLSQKKLSADLLAGGDDGARAFQKIVDGILKIKDPVKQSQTALALFGTPLEDLSVTEIPKFLKGLGESTGKLNGFEGATRDAADTMSDNAQSNITAFTRKLEVFAIDTIGNKVLPKVNEWTKWFDDNLLPAIKDGIEKLEGFGKWVQDNTGWLLPLGTAIAIVVGGLALMNFATGVMAAGGFLKWIMDISKATSAWTAIQWLFNAAMAANPIGLIIIGIAALVAAFIVAYNTSEDFRNIVNGAIEKVKEVALAVIDWFTGPFAKFWVDLWETCARNVTGFFEAVQRIWNDLTSFVGDKVGAMGKGIQDGFNSAKDWALGALDGLSDGAKGVWDGLNSYQQRWNGAFGKLLKGDFGGFAKDVQGIWSDMTKGLTKVWEGFQKGVGDIWDKLPADIKAPIRSAVAWINDTFIGGINGMLSKLSISWRIPQIPGFAEGGYTGNGAKHQVAGLVHAGEVVWSQDDVAAWGGPEAVDNMRRRRGEAATSNQTGDLEGGYARGGIVPNARQGFRGYNPAFLAAIKAWAAASGRTWYMTGNGGARSFADQLRAWNLYKAGKGPLAANPYKGGPHMIPGNAMDLNPHPRGNPLLRAFGLGTPVPSEGWHVGWAGGGRRGGGAATGGGGGSFDFGLGSLISGLLKKLNVVEPWESVIETALKRTPGAILKSILGGYAMGTDNADAGIASVAENGAELVLGKSLRAFRGGERVLTASETSNVLGSGLSADDIRKALDGLRVDLDNGRLFFDKNMARHDAKLNLDSHLVGAGGVA